MVKLIQVVRALSVNFKILEFTRAARNVNKGRKAVKINNRAFMPPKSAPAFGVDN